MTPFLPPILEERDVGVEQTASLDACLALRHPFHPQVAAHSPAIQLQPERNLALGASLAEELVGLFME
jgi:hypothetical protein